jgi:hypothetical protein
MQTCPNLVLNAIENMFEGKALLLCPGTQIVLAKKASYLVALRRMEV